MFGNWALHLVYSLILLQKLYSHLPIFFFIFFRGMGIVKVDGSWSSKRGVCLELPWQKPALTVSFFPAQFGNEMFSSKSNLVLPKRFSPVCYSIKKKYVVSCVVFSVHLLKLMTIKWELMSSELKNCQKCCSLCHFTLEVCFLHWKQVLLDWLTQTNAKITKNSENLKCKLSQNFELMI